MSDTPVVETAETEVEEKVETPEAAKEEEEQPKTEEEVEKDPAATEEKPKEEEEEKEEEKRKKHSTIRWENHLKRTYKAEARAEYLEKQLRDLQQQQSPKQPAGAPDRKSFSSDEEYVQKLNAWTVDQRMATVKQELAQQQQDSRVQTEWAQKITQARADYSDYDSTMSDAADVPVSEALESAIQSSEFGGDIVYFLAKNPDEALRLNSLNQIAAAREIGRIESYIEYEKSQVKKPVVASKAPAPIKPVKTSGAAQKSLEDMTPAEFIAFRNKQAANKR